MKSIIEKLKKKSMGWWTLVITIFASLVALIAWLWPEPLNPHFNLTPQPTTIAQSLGITEPIHPRKPGVVRILVAKFDEASQTNYRLTELILANLRSALATYPDTEVVAMDRVITEKDGSNLAIEIGKIYDASIVIWGWYGLTETAVPLAIHFDIIQSSETFHPNSCGVTSVKARTQFRKATPIELSDLTLQTNLSNELSYVTIFTLGVSRYDAEDWQNAILMFNDALTYLTDETVLSAKIEGSGILVDQNLLYYYRGIAYEILGNYTATLDDLGKIPNPNIAIYLEIASALTGLGDNDKAIETYSVVIENGQTSLTSLASLRRGFLYEKTGRLELANKDFRVAIQADQESIPELNSIIETQGNELDFLTSAISNNPNNPLYYYWRGIQYQKQNLDDMALGDFNHAINLVSDFYVAREARSHILLNKDDYQSTLEDLNFIFQMAEFQTPCNLQNRGVSYEALHNYEEATQDFLKVISLTTQAINDNPEEVIAYYIRYLAYTTLSDRTFFTRILPFQANPIYALRDLLKFRQLKPPEIIIDIDYNKEYLILIWLVIRPYFLWALIICLVIIKKKLPVIFSIKNLRRKTTTHAHRP